MTVSYRHPSCVIQAMPGFENHRDDVAPAAAAEHDKTCVPCGSP